VGLDVGLYLVSGIWSIRFVSVQFNWRLPGKHKYLPAHFYHSASSIYLSSDTKLWPKLFPPARFDVGMPMPGQKHAPRRCRCRNLPRSRPTPRRLPLWIRMRQMPMLRSWTCCPFLDRLRRRRRRRRRRPLHPTQPEAAQSSNWPGINYATSRTCCQICDSRKNPTAN